MPNEGFVCAMVAVEAIRKETSKILNFITIGGTGFINALDLHKENIVQDFIAMQ